MASTTTIVTKISIEDIEKTYNGEQGCACGCGGDYMYTNETPATAAKHIAKINARLKSNSSDVENGGNYFSIEGVTRATRIYFKDGIRYGMMGKNLFRTETIAE
jgi:hypothetical protein